MAALTTVEARSRALLAAVVAALALAAVAGCGVDAEEGAPEISTTVDDDGTRIDGGAEDDDQSASPSTAVEVASGLPDDAQLDLQVAHPTGPP
ncbi:hypothetical protein BH20ACT2_BH20ACT2_12390 [soil metagenome]